MIHLDKQAVSEDEMHGRTGGHHEYQRPVKKTLCDMKFLMNFVIFKVKEVNAWEDVITMAAVDQMFQAVGHVLLEGDHDGQKKWNTVVNVL